MWMWDMFVIEHTEEKNAQNLVKWRWTKKKKVLESYDEWNNKLKRTFLPTKMIRLLFDFFFFLLRLSFDSPDFVFIILWLCFGSFLEHILCMRFIPNDTLKLVSVNRIFVQYTSVCCCAGDNVFYYGWVRRRWAQYSTFERNDEEVEDEEERGKNPRDSNKHKKNAVHKRTAHT